MTSILPNPLDAVICDMDGLLLDTEAAHWHTMRDAAGALGFVLPFETFQRMVGVDRLHNKQMLVAEYGDAFPLDDFYAESDARFEAIVRDGLTPRPGVAELLDTLDALGLRRAVATSTSSPWAQERLRFAGLYDRFEYMVTFNDVERPKPAPDPYLKAASLLGARPAHCLALEDSHNGVRAAAAAGCATIMVPDLLAATDEMRVLTVAVMPSLAEVAALLRRELGGGAEGGARALRP